MSDMPLVAEDASWRERLFSMIGSEDGRLEPYIRLWREGQVPCWPTIRTSKRPAC